MYFTKYFTVAMVSMFKFGGGALAGLHLKLSFIETLLSVIAGMMIGVFLSVFFGEQIKKHIVPYFYRRKRLFTKRNRKMVRMWRKYGIIGIAFLTPLILNPIGGTLVVVSFGEQRRNIFVYMLVSAVFWGTIIVSIVYLFGGIGKA